MQLILSKSTIRSFRPSDAPLTNHIGTHSVARNRARSRILTRAEIEVIDGPSPLPAVTCRDGG